MNLLRNVRATDSHLSKFGRTGCSGSSEAAALWTQRRARFQSLRASARCSANFTTRSYNSLPKSLMRSAFSATSCGFSVSNRSQKSNEPDGLARTTRLSMASSMSVRSCSNAALKKDSPATNSPTNSGMASNGFLLFPDSANVISTRADLQSRFTTIHSERDAATQSAAVGLLHPQRVAQSGHETFRRGPDGN